MEACVGSFEDIRLCQDLFTYLLICSLDRLCKTRTDNHTIPDQKKTFVYYTIKNQIEFCQISQCVYFAWAILHQFSSFSISFLAFTSLYIFLLNISSPYLICYLFSSFLFLPSSLVLLLQFFPRVSKSNFCQLSIFFSPRVIKWKMMPLLYLLCWHRLF